MARISIVFMLSSLILLGTTASNDTEKCESDDLHHQCTDGSRKCIPVAWLCDGKRDCENGEDEEGQTCEPRGSKPNFFERGRCPPRQFECEDFAGQHKCILEQWRCDRHIDCKNGRDEEGCDYFAEKPETQFQSLSILSISGRLNCTESQFPCKTIKECLPSRSMVCNGRKDCLDGSDEIGCQEEHSPATGEQAAVGTQTRQIINRLSSTSIIPLFSQNSATNFLVNLSTVFSQQRKSLDTKENVSQAGLIDLSEAIRGGTEIAPISPRSVGPVSASANKPQRVTMQRIESRTDEEGRYTQSTQTVTETTTFVSTLSSLAIMKREQKDLFPQFKTFGNNYLPIVPQL